MLPRVCVKCHTRHWCSCVTSNTSMLFKSHTGSASSWRCLVQCIKKTKPGLMWGIIQVKKYLLFNSLTISAQADTLTLMLNTVVWHWCDFSLGKACGRLKARGHWQHHYTSSSSAADNTWGGWGWTFGHSDGDIFPLTKHLHHLQPSKGQTVKTE